jgi:predicted metallopeptidase
MELKVEFSRLGSIVLKEPTTLELKHTMLYGRSGAGKSLIMKATIAESTIYEDVRLHLLPGLYDLKRLLKTSDFKVIVGGRTWRMARITAGTARLIVERDEERRRYNISVGSQLDLQRLLSNPEFAEKVNSFFDLWRIGIEVYGGFFRERGGEWIKVVNLPYSYRRIIAMLYALEKCDVVFIEAFDSGLHMSMLKYLIEHISTEYKGKVIVAEVHHTPAVVFGLSRGWIVYVVEKDRITRLERIEDIKNTDVFFRELAEVRHL